MDISKDIRKFKKRLTLASNRFTGNLKEKTYSVAAQAGGKEVQRTGKGSDYRERKVDLLTGKKGRWKYVEVKSGGAKLSKLQKKTKKKMGGKYKVVRSESF